MPFSFPVNHAKPGCCYLPCVENVFATSLVLGLDGSMGHRGVAHGVRCVTKWSQSGHRLPFPLNVPLASFPLSSSPRYDPLDQYRYLHLQSCLPEGGNTGQHGSVAPRHGHAPAAPAGFEKFVIAAGPRPFECRVQCPDLGTSWPPSSSPFKAAELKFDKFFFFLLLFAAVSRDAPPETET